MCTMNVMLSSHSEIEVCWETDGDKKGEGSGKGREKRRNVLNFYRDELIAVLSLDQEVICTRFYILACVMLKSLGYLETASLLHASSAC